MPTADDTWTVLPHGPLENIAENLWRVEGSLPGMPLRRVMTITRLSGASLVFHNGVALSPEAMGQIEALGAPSTLIVPSGYHRLDAPAYKRRYPGIKVLCPRSARRRVSEVVPVDGTYDDFPKDDAVTLSHLAGVNDLEGVLKIASRDGATLVFNDAVFNSPHLPGAAGFLLRYVTASTGGPKVSRLFRLFVVKDRRAFKADLLRLADTPNLRRIIVAHVDVITERPAEALRQAAAAL
jgi:hypothetical protein